MDSSIDEVAAQPGGADRTPPATPSRPPSPPMPAPTEPPAGDGSGTAPGPASGTAEHDGRAAPVPAAGGEDDAPGTAPASGTTETGCPGTAGLAAGGAAVTGTAVTGTGQDSGSGTGGGRGGPPTSLSPSRASDFMQCPLLYRFRVIDRLPEKPSAAATRGTLVHAVLERLFDAPAGERTAPRAKALIPGQWDRLRETRPEVTELFADDPDGERLAGWLAEAERLVERWFTLEDPTRLEPAERELFVEAELESGLRLRGIIDRVDVAPTGEVRIVDYKTGKAPRPEYAEGALFQMKFYALVVWRLKRVVPRRLQLVYLGSGDVLTYDPVPADLERVERRLHALWEAIRQATETGDWRPRPTKLCGWCDHRAHCPEFGGTPPPYPLPVGPAGSSGTG
ncbi:PD-(D/E)XK nuclease superfamily protein [Streptomyces cyanogenus]|uniref:PD-(D/E)XK nuclease superfamily protein n=1 Tax=Streptomyces cyanogenus TaxID=80860 RepID=A0ABX7TLB1_STRCY|nr:PD-(D/E)XK nuclease superfamily protein [Streptomyces cyanogenus]